MLEANYLESLPVELIADILSELDLTTLITVSCLSRRLRSIVSEPALNPWRRPILRNLRAPSRSGDPLPLALPLPDNDNDNDAAGGAENDGMAVDSPARARYEPCLKHLAVRATVPRQNWVEILSLASVDFLLFEATLPGLKDAEWEEAFRRRFLPGWVKWKKAGISWKAVFMK